MMRRTLLVKRSSQGAQARRLVLAFGRRLLEAEYRWLALSIVRANRAGEWKIFKFITFSRGADWAMTQQRI
jgi:hypothetical protein